MGRTMLRYAARTDIGMVRSHNEDSGYAGPRLLAVADGMGGYAAGEVASAAVLDCVTALDGRDPGPDLEYEVHATVLAANARLRSMILEDRSCQGMGTTLTALLWDGAGRVTLAHIGDSRAYLLRDGALHRLTLDHTFVQTLVDSGRLAPEEVATHPQRSLLTRAMTGLDDMEPDIVSLETRAGDRYLVCSDGLTAVIRDDTLAEVLSGSGAPDDVARELINLANRGGGPDNITCVVADVLEADDLDTAPPGALIVGAAGEAVAAHAVLPDLPMGGAPAPPASAFGPPLPYADPALPAEPARRRGRAALRLCLAVLLMGALGLAAWYAFRR
ncbi:PP2C family serine/threonine-protein phosphatase [Streptomyces diastaticus]|uniref:PP2C family protein-serine/threonine phosphatase n=1 Tax=Streptomyces diastaticus TaxID=1956 RepID=UPI0033C2781E